MRQHRKSRRPGRGDLAAPPAAAEALNSFGHPSRSASKKHYKDLQLCRQAYRTLSVALAGGYGDERLAAFVVRAVLPAPDAGRLLVCLEPGAGGGPAVTDLADILARLERLRPALRREVAEALVRKRAPELEFVVMPRQEVRP